MISTVLPLYDLTMSPGLLASLPGIFSAHGSAATIFRSGVWKPRTRPGTFEGNGVKALPWLQKVKEETGMLTAVEIANAHHAKMALEFDIDVLWIGARTTVNPFAVQEIAEAIQGTEKIVLVKNWIKTLPICSTVRKSREAPVFFLGTCLSGSFPKLT